MNYLKIEFELPPDLHEFFIAELIDLDFYGFEQFDNKLAAYVEKSRFNDSNREYLEQLISAYSGNSLVEIEEVQEQNWNEAWEQTIQPRRVGRFLVKPTWSAEVPDEGEILLEIDPKMSFGTGYHASTRLVLNQIQKMNLAGKKVLDAGTGTGILAIGAVKLGADKAVGFDTDTWSRDNARENTFINKVDHSVEIRFGGTETVDESEIFDVTLANINRNIILDNLSFFVHHTEEGGIICLSGLLQTDEDSIRNRLAGHPVEVTDVEQEDEWILFQLLKSTQ